jgi:hypothetical protein
LKGKVRVYCRIRPMLKHEADKSNITPTTSRLLEHHPGAR